MDKGLSPGHDPFYPCNRQLKQLGSHSEAIVEDNEWLETTVSPKKGAIDLALWL